MNMILCFVVALTISVSKSYQSEISCGSSEYASLKIRSMSHPVVLKEGADFVADFEVHIKKQFPATFFADVSLKRKILFAWIPIPCVKEVGSCKYKITCDMINKMQDGNADDVACPARPGVVSRKVALKMPAIPGAVSAVGGGTYELTITLLDEKNHKLACSGRRVEVRT